MKVVILAGGLGTRLSEETHVKPKPMVEIGGKPIIWHIMKHYSTYGFNDFVICLGYKGYYIKEYFFNYHYHNSNLQIDLGTNSIESFSESEEPWKVTLIDTGDHAMTGSRLKKVAPYLTDTFMMTYGDGVSNINIEKLIQFHTEHGKEATLTAVQPEGRFGALEIDQDNIIGTFKEKPVGDGSWINGGFFVLNKSVLNRIDDSRDDVVWEQEPLMGLASDRELASFKHEGFWKPMDTLRDKNYLESLWKSGNADWKTW